MKKIMLTTMMTAVALSAVAPSSPPASAAAKVKVKSGKLVNASTGKVVKGTVVYKKRLYKNGVLAKGTILHKKVLYVNGKIKEGVVRYKNKFYLAGKLVGSDVYIFYKKKMYLNNKPAVNNRQNKLVIQEDGGPFIGIYEGNLYASGQLTYTANNSLPYKIYNQRVSYSADGSTVTCILTAEAMIDISFYSKNMSVNNNAIIKKVDIINYQDLRIVLGNIKRNTIYEFKIKDFLLYNSPLNLKVQLSGITDEFDKKYNFTEINTFYHKNKNLSNKELRKLAKTKKGKEIIQKIKTKRDQPPWYMSYKTRTAAETAYDTVIYNLYGLFEEELQALEKQ